LFSVSKKFHVCCLHPFVKRFRDILCATVSYHIWLHLQGPVAALVSWCHRNVNATPFWLPHPSFARWFFKCAKEVSTTRTSGYTNVVQY